jgi:REP element-mobilizing transposase RayT
MPADILVITPAPALGESIRRVLEETTLYRIHVVNNKASAVVRADEVGIPLAMLDLALGESWVQEIGSALRTIHKGINLIVLCEEDVSPPAFDDLRPWILVHKPFSMTDFMTAISKPLTAPVPQQEEENMPWLGDQNKAAQHLTRLTLSSSAQAALITRKNDLWAYAGGLSHEAAKELAQAVTRNWDGQKGSDLLRFIRLESTKAEHMLYATHLAANTVLALVFDAETPFSTIRNQATQLVSDLDKFEQPKPSKPAQDITGEYPAMEEENTRGENIPPITNILTDIPSPNPNLKSEADAPRKKPQKIQFDPNETRISEPLSDASAFNREASPVVRLTPVARREPIKPVKSVNVDVESQPVADNNVEVTVPSRPQPRTATPIAPPAVEAADMAVTRESSITDKRTPTPVAAPTDSADVTRESSTTEAARKLVVEPLSAGLYHLTYACLLVPRFSTHFIAGDLAERLDEWLPNICIAFGWRLEFLAVRPDYLQWVVNVQPNTSPGYLMRVIRQQTSEKIFKDFPRFKKENASNDFWAPGYLIMGGSQPHPPQLVKDYINQTRQRQGQKEASPDRK